MYLRSVRRADGLQFVSNGGIAGSTVAAGRLFEGPAAGLRVLDQGRGGCYHQEELDLVIHTVGSPVQCGTLEFYLLLMHTTI